MAALHHTAPVAGCGGSTPRFNRMHDVTRLMESGTQSRARHDEKCCVVRERFAPFVRFPSRSELEAPDACAAWRTGTGAVRELPCVHAERRIFILAADDEGKEECSGIYQGDCDEIEGQGQRNPASRTKHQLFHACDAGRDCNAVQHEGGRIRGGRYSGSKGPGDGASETRACCAEQRVCDEQCT